MLKTCFKYILVLFVIAIIIIAFNIIYNKDAELDQDGVSITVINDTITTTGARFLIKSEKTKYRLSWSSDQFKIQQKIFNKWKDIPVINENPYSIEAFCLSNDENKAIHNVNWEIQYGILKKGTYRVALYYLNVYSGDKEFYSEPFKIK